MKEIYKASGSLNKRFIGQITYTVCLEKSLKKLDIGFEFDKAHYTPEQATPELICKIKDLPDGDIIIPKLFGDENNLEKLVCVAPVIKL